MTSEAPFTEEEVKRSRNVSPDSAMVAAASFNGLRVIDHFIRCYITPALRSSPRATGKALCLQALHMRLGSSAAALAVLHSVAHINAIAIVARAVFELWVDVRAIDRDTYPDAVEKFWTYVRKERLRMAQQAVGFDDKHPGVLRPEPSAQREFIRSDAAVIESRALSLWSHSSPKHWSGTSDIRQRAAAADLEDRYITLYPQLSSYSHGGAAAIEGLDPDAFNAMAHLAHDLSTDALLDSLRILGVAFSLPASIPGFSAKLSFLENVTGFVLTDLCLIAQGEPPRINLDLGPCPDSQARA